MRQGPSRMKKPPIIAASAVNAIGLARTAAASITASPSSRRRKCETRSIAWPRAWPIILTVVHHNLEWTHPIQYSLVPPDMDNTPTPSASLRQLGRSRTYTQADLPERLTRWHAPRANRWECLHVTAGRLCTQWLGAGGASTARMQAGDHRWIAPGMRWRIARMDVDTCFELQIFAAEALPVGAPQPLRSALLDDAGHVQVDNSTAFTAVIANLASGAERLLHGRFDVREALCAALDAGDARLFWHPLEMDAEKFTAFVTRSAEPITLPDYLGRDHAVIEAALAGALRGETEYTRWLHATLARHLAIEEELLFPAWLAAGGRKGWVDGLLNEHARLRQELPRLSAADSRRRFLLLLDGHDEKEEQIVYPDILARLGSDAAALTRAAMLRSS